MNSLDFDPAALENSTPIVFWFTGLPGAGKTTIAKCLERRLRELNLPVVCLDGDDVRHTISEDLDFSDEDRAENSRRVAEVSKFLAESDFVVIASFVSPLRLDRKVARRTLKSTFFVETFIDAPIEVCE